jgi:hypothetical protein
MDDLERVPDGSGPDHSDGYCAFKAQQLKLGIALDREWW